MVEPTPHAPALTPEDEELEQIEVLIEQAIDRIGDRAPAAALPAIRMALAEFYLTSPVAIDLLAELRSAPVVGASGERVRHAEDALLDAMARRARRAQGGDG